MLSRFAAVFAALFMFVAALPASAGYPDKPVRLVVTYAPGGPADISARLIGAELGKQLGQSFIIDNRAGAGGNIGADIVAKAAPDGYTLLMIGAAQSINKTFYEHLSYDVQRDFVPVATVATAPLVLMANASSGISTMQQLVAAAKSPTNKLSYCSSGNGTAPHLTMEWLKSAAGLTLLHVPYKGSAPCVTDVISGQIQLYFESMLVWQQYANSGKLNALAITGGTRSDAAPTIPTMAEVGYPQVETSVWYGVMAPTGTPSAVVQLLNTQIKAILAGPDIQKRLRELGAEPMLKSPSEFKAFLDKDVANWGKVVKLSGARAD